MEENTPMQEVDTVPQGQPHSSAAAEEAATGTTTENAEAEGTTPASAPGQEAGTVQDDALIVQYNHEERRLTREEAIALAQKGLRLDRLEEQAGAQASDIAPLLDKLRFLAVANSKSLPEMVDALVESQDKQVYQALLEECDGNESLANRLFEAEKAKRQSLYEDSRRQETAAAQKAKDDLAARLASEFLELKAEFPELSEFSAVPGSVLDMAVKGVNLTDAYLRYQHTESKKAAAAKASQEAAAKASAGSQAAGGGETVNPTIDAMLAGIWRR